MTKTIDALVEALRPFAEVDLRTQGVHQKFAEHVLAARAALSQARAEKAEPVAWMAIDGRVATAETKNRSMPKPSKEAFCIPLYTTPPAAPVAKLEPLTIREIADLTAPWGHVRSDYSIGIVRAAEAAHNAKLCKTQTR